MSSRHGNKRKKNKTARPPARVVVVNDPLCQEHPDSKKEPDMNKTDENASPLRWYEHGGLTLFIAVLAMVGSVSQACFTRQTMMVDQRAWVGLSTIIGVPKRGEPFSVDVHFKNSGKTPAIAFTPSVWEKVLSKDELPKCGADQRPSGVEVLQPNSDHIATVPITNPGMVLSEQSDLAFSSGNSVLFIHGKLWYKDVFRDEHWTVFCYHMTTANVFEPCGQCNDTDDDH